MITISDCSPIHFWPKGVDTFNDSRPGFILARPYYHELLFDDIQKLQLTDDDGRAFGLVIIDEFNNVLSTLSYTVLEIGDVVTQNDIEFQFSTLGISDKRVRVYIVQLTDTFDDTFDPTFRANDAGVFDFTFDPTFLADNYVFKSDFLDVRSSIDSNMGWGSVLLKFKSIFNYYGIRYPNNGNYFNLRFPARFFSERIQETVNEVLLSSSVLTTSRTQKFQTYLEPYQLPTYMLKKIAGALSHDVTGSVMINGVEYQASDSFDWSPTDVKAPFSKGKVWLTDKNNFLRNII